jgi:hypothetical protein
MQEFSVLITAEEETFKFFAVETSGGLVFTIL